MDLNKPLSKKTQFRIILGICGIFVILYVILALYLFNHIEQITTNPLVYSAKYFDGDAECSCTFEREGEFGEVYFNETSIWTNELLPSNQFNKELEEFINRNSSEIPQEHGIS